MNRATPARDVFDLVWIIRHQEVLGRQLELDLVRRLATMKIWVDMYGLRSQGHEWKKGHDPRAFDVEDWLRIRAAREFDDENIGMLASPPPALDELGEALSREYGFLRELDSDERNLARCHGGDKTLLLSCLDGLPDTQLPSGTCW